MATRKFKMTALKAHLAAINDLIAESDAAMEAEGNDDGQRIERLDNNRANDSPPPTPGTPRAPAQDAAPGVSPLDTRTSRRLTARGDSAAARSLSSIPGYSRLQR